MGEKKEKDCILELERFLFYLLFLQTCDYIGYL